MIKITYDPIYGAAIADGRAEFTAKEWIMHKNVEATISSGLVIDWLRVAVCEKTLPLEDIEIYYKPEFEDPIKLTMTPQGRFTFWPRGFYDYMERALARLI